MTKVFTKKMSGNSEIRSDYKDSLFIANKQELSTYPLYNFFSITLLSVHQVLKMKISFWMPCIDPSSSFQKPFHKLQIDLSRLIIVSPLYVCKCIHCIEWDLE